MIRAKTQSTPSWTNKIFLFAPWRLGGINFLKVVCSTFEKLESELSFYYSWRPIDKSSLS
jgi:hypothetical protein